MTEGLRWRFTFILILALVAGYVVAPMPNKPFLKDVKYTLGIDLQGGAELRYRVLDIDEKNGDKPAEITRDTLAVIQRRLDAKLKGLLEPLLTSHGTDEIIMQIPGVDADKLQEYKNLMKQMGKLELCEVGSEDLHKRYPDPMSPPAGYTSKSNPVKSGDAAYIRGDFILIKNEPLFTGRDLDANEIRARAEMEKRGFAVSFKISDRDAKNRFAEATQRLVKEKGYIAIVLDDAVHSHPIVHSPITDGSGEISGGFKNIDEARELALILRSGSLPKPIGRYLDDGTKQVGEPESESFVGPTLGQDAIQRGLISFGAAFVFVVLFMLIYYQAGGVIAVIAVVLNLLLLMFTMSVFGATLTLPGIAGIILTLGMAVDGNILILERIREEKAKGKTAVQASEAGHARAYVTIIDANLTTLFTAIILYLFGTGPVKGFGITLAIGIMTTIFTVTFCTNVFTRMMLVNGMIKEFRMMHLFKNPKINFIKIYPIMVTLSLIAMGLSCFFYFNNTDKILGTDFTGGVTMTLNFEEKKEIAQVRKAIHEFSRGPARPYAGTVIQPIFPASSGLLPTGQSQSPSFQIRMGQEHQEKIEEIKKDFMEVFKELKSSRPPFDALPKENLEGNNRSDFYVRPEVIQEHGMPGTLVYIKNKPPVDFAALQGRIETAVKDIVKKDSLNADRPMIRITPGPAADNLLQVAVLITEDDLMATGTVKKLDKVKDAIKKALGAQLSKDPITGVGKIGPQVVAELKSSTIWALIWSWVSIILYVGYRFMSIKFGMAAVVALIHDAVIAVGAVAACAILIPKEYGLSFEITMNTVAAVMTIIGFSVNDTIVTFDRIRENLTLMRRDTFRDIINTSINQTLSRTVLTSFTAWLSVIALYVFNIGSGSGIETFAFPLIVGILVGTYSSIYIAAPLLLRWYKDSKPVAKSG